MNKLLVVLAAAAVTIVAADAAFAAARIPFTFERSGDASHEASAPVCCAPIDVDEPSKRAPHPTGHPHLLSPEPLEQTTWARIKWHYDE